MCVYLYVGSEDWIQDLLMLGKCSTPDLKTPPLHVSLLVYYIFFNNQ